MDKKQLVSKLIQQHGILQVDLEKLTKETIGETIVSGLVRFKNDLLEHLNLENNIFYKELLEVMKEKGQDAKKTEDFIKSMDNIAKSVMEFLNKYSSPELILKDFSAFQHELKAIISALNTRIESEEEGVYEFFLAL